MKIHPLIEAEELPRLMSDGEAVAVDCRFDFSNPAKGRADWLAGHIPGAHYADLDRDLAAPVTPQSGRHPLPDEEAFARFLASIAWTPEKVLVAYDAGNAMIAARLWWQMRYLGHRAQVLNGGLAAWRAAGLPLEAGEVKVEATAPSRLAGDRGSRIDTGEVESLVRGNRFTLLDARAPDRFRGENETLDTAGGHIPGAVNAFFAHNLESDGRFKSPGALRSRFEELLQGAEPAEVVHSCGSGVSACHNLLAMEVAGLEGSRLYPGSWSEWIRDPGRPIETG